MIKKIGKMFMVLGLFLFLITLTSCGFYNDIYDLEFDDISKISGLEREEKENYAIYKFDNFNGRATLKMERKGLSEGTIYYYANITKGLVNLKYDTGPLDKTLDLCSISDIDKMPISSNGGYIDHNQNKIAIIFETTSPISGEIIISFVPISE